MDNLQFSAKRIGNEGVLVAAQSFDGDIYRNIIDDFKTTQFPEETFLVNKCRDLVIENITQTKYTASPDLGIVNCEVPLLGNVVVKCVLTRVVEEVKDHGTAIQNIMALLKERKTIVTLDVIEDIPINFRLNDLKSLPFYQYIETTVNWQNYLALNYKYSKSSASRSTLYFISDRRIDIHQPTIDDFTIEYNIGTYGNSILRSIDSGFNVSNESSAQYTNISIVTLDDYKKVLDVNDTTPLLKYEHKNCLYVMKRKILVLIQMICHGWRIKHLPLYRYYKHLYIDVIAKPDNTLTIKFTVDKKDRINSIHQCSDNGYFNQIISETDPNHLSYKIEVSCYLTPDEYSYRAYRINM